MTFCKSFELNLSRSSGRHTVGYLIVLLATISPHQVQAQTLMQFDRSALLEQTAETSANVSIGDLDGDGHLDIVLVKGRHWPLDDLLLMGDGTGSFDEPRVLSSTADRSYSGVLIDIDSDGDLDVVVSNDRPDQKLIYRNNGRAVFEVSSTFGAPQWPTRHVDVEDMNGDGLPDIIVANRTGDNSGNNYICFNHGEGRFDNSCLPFSSESATTIAVADFNDDGNPDLAVPNREGGQSYIYFNDGSGRIASRVPFGPMDAAIRSAEAADINGDGRLDIVAIDQNRGPGILERTRTGGFATWRSLDGSDAVPYAFAVSDLNGDHDIDLIIGYVESSPLAYFGNGRGEFTAVEFGDDQGVAYGFSTGDIDEDGYIDIAMARSGAPNVLYFGGPSRD